jgi:ribulose-5-phosphate 4-epimerase/fuculose-1-phosphate aldolase
VSIVTEHRELARELCRYARLSYSRHLVGAAGGNISARVPGRAAYIVTASDLALRDAQPSQLVVVDARGELLEGGSGLRPSKETAFHLSIYRSRPEVNAVVHVHPTYATVFSLWKMRIPAATISASLKLKQGPVVGAAAPGSRDLCDRIEAAVRSSGAEVGVLLLEGHGLVAFDSTLRGAFNTAELAEDTARIAYLSELGGTTRPEGPAGS